MYSYMIKYCDLKNILYVEFSVKVSVLIFPEPKKWLKDVGLYVCCCRSVDPLLAQSYRSDVVKTFTKPVTKPKINARKVVLKISLNNPHFGHNII